MSVHVEGTTPKPSELHPAVTGGTPLTTSNVAHSVVPLELPSRSHVAVSIVPRAALVDVPALVRKTIIDALRVHNEAANAEVGQLRAEGLVWAQERETLRAALAHLEHNMQAVQLGREAIARELDGVRATTASLQAQQHDLLQQLAGARQAADAIHAVVASVAEQQRIARQSECGAVTELAQCRETVAALQQQLRQCQAQLETARGDEASLAGAAAERERAQREHAARLEELERLRAVSADLARQNTDLMAAATAAATTEPSCKRVRVDAETEAGIE